MMLTTLLATGLSTASAQGYRPPNSTLAASVGTPWLLGGRGEAWFADELSAELGAGVLGATDSAVGVDVTLRWRPDALCFGCNSRVLATVGIGVSAMIVPDLALAGPWQTAIGPDLALTVVYWFGPAYGLSISGRGGAGLALDGTAVAEGQPKPWGFGSVGLAF